ncbi:MULTISPECIES: FAD-dependent oxidoreductase [unclassified Acinetobacter]|uniref:FAD-dependent oxidoreductase n=1 Tax=unclassified Acinetobacter TaxID=196816 RepID=UPI00190B9985|nr:MULTISPECIES: NAD(P)/FAD-dependent oxidoreductase [unclassified Acinetobacter]MBK0062814.1 FAD-dependent monooxygenase [Acinetobacter sp. S55]MBK0065609.1 FAD-dependent monooxygenase [Acinetobacter sp. S54]
MKKIKDIAIIGAGTAGLATAILLARQDFHVTLFEKVESLQPVGAGLLLQPAGLAVFEHLGLLDKALELGAMVTGLQGQLANQRLLVNSHYHEVDPQHYGVGIHRATLCHLLSSKLEQYAGSVTWKMSHEIDELHEHSDGVIVRGQYQGQSFESSFDAVIIANGARSHLRPPAWVKVDKAYPWGAVWSIVSECKTLDPQILHQFYDRSHIMMGILPTGAVPQTPAQRLSSVFWSLPTQQLQQFLENPQKHDFLLHQISSRWRPIADWLEQTMQTDENLHWLSAQYRDVVMTKFGQGRIGVIGDAAHAMSPQLGQGANMALLDAWALGQAMQQFPDRQVDWAKFWQHYHELRYSSTQFYQLLSRLLTPLYQSDSTWAGPFRDFSFYWMYQIPYLRKQMALTISGLKTAPLRHMNYAEIAKTRHQAAILSQNLS